MTVGVTPHPDHPGTADLYDAVEQAVVDHKSCRTDNTQQTYWRTWHTREARAKSLAADHNRTKHGSTK